MTAILKRLLRVSALVGAILGFAGSPDAFAHTLSRDVIKGRRTLGIQDDSQGIDGEFGRQLDGHELHAEFLQYL